METSMNTWGLRGTVAAVGVATVIAGFGGAAIYAATGSDVHLMGAHNAPAPPRSGGGPPQQHDASGPNPLDASALHGESVVSDGSGGFTTELSQTGTITAIDATSVSARSADGYSQTYVIPAAATAPPFNVGDQVTIRATRRGADATVTTIRPPLR
jgi:hypothetical protein